MAEQQNKSPEFNINLGDIYKAVWKHLPFPGAKKAGISSQVEPFPNVPADGVDYAGVPQSLLGTPQFFEMTIGGLKLPNAPLITVTGSKEIIKTKVAGGNWTVKEIISMDDYRINIKGVAVSKPSERASSGVVPSDYPEEWVRRLRELYERNEALEVSCQLLSYFNISQLVIEDISFPAIPGAQSFVPFEINALSDVPVELLLISNAEEVR